MTSLLPHARLLIASWTLADDPGDSGPGPVPPIPASDGTLDRALLAAKAAGVFPAWFWEPLHFADGRTGLVCVELEDVLARAIVACLADWDAETYRTLRVQVRPETAERLLQGSGVTVEEAMRWGGELRRILASQEGCGSNTVRIQKSIQSIMKGTTP
jgi:hypothetical protein